MMPSDASQTSHPRSGRISLSTLVTLGVIVLILFLVARSVIANQSALFGAKLQAVLEEELGRPVTVSGASLGFPIRVREIIVAGDGVIDTEPIFILRNARAMPDIFSIIRFQSALGAVSFDSAIVSFREAPDGSWSTKGLLPKPPTEVPAIRLLHMPNLEMRVTARGRTFSRKMSGTIQLHSYGGYRLVLNDSMVHAGAEFNGIMANPALYTFRLSLDSVPSPMGTEDVRCSAVYNPGRKSLAFEIASRLFTQPAALRGLIFFDTHTVRCDSGSWNIGDGLGMFRANYDDRLKEPLFLEQIGRIDLPASLLLKKFPSGTISLDRLAVKGSIAGPLAIEAGFNARGLSTGRSDAGMDRHTAGSPSAVGLTIAGTVGAEWNQSKPIALAKTRIEIGFDAISAAGNTLRNGRFRITGDEDDLLLNGKAGGLGGGLELTDLRVHLGDDFQPRSVDGRISGREIELAALGVGGGDFRVQKASGAWEIRAAAHPRTGEWDLDQIEGTVEKASFTFKGRPGTVSRGRLDLASLGGWRGGARGRLEFLGGAGNIHAFLRGGEVDSVTFDLDGLHTDEIEKLFPGDLISKLALHTETLGGRGSLAVLRAPAVRSASIRTAVEKGWIFSGSLSSPRFRFRADPPKQERGHEVKCDLECYIPENPERDGSIDLVSGTLSIGNNRTRLSIPRTKLQSGVIQTRVTIHAIDVVHLRDAAALYAPDRPLSRLPLTGLLKGWVDLDMNGDAFKAELDLEGNLELRNSTLSLHAFGNVSDREPNLIIDVKSVSLPALLTAAADYDTRIDGEMVRLEGTGGAWLTVIGSSWSDLNIDGLLRMRNANIEFPQYQFGLTGVTGELPFRLQRAQKLELTPMDASMARELEIRRIHYKELFVIDLKGMARFNEKTLVYENVAFEFAEAKGRGAFAIDFPKWDEPRTAFFGEITGCSVGVVYRTMQPFAGRLEGTANAKIELKTEGADIIHLLARGQITDGTLGSELLVGVVNEMKPSVTKDALLSLTEWDFTEATLNFDYKSNYYSPATARNKFGDSSRRYEVLGNIEVTGPVYPLDRFRILGRIRPFNFVGINVDLKIEDAQMRLLMDRVGRRQAAP